MQQAAPFTSLNLPNNITTVITADGINADIIQAIISLAPAATTEVEKFAQQFKKSTTEKTAFAIWYFLRTRARYVRDRSDLQQIRLPNRFIFDTYTHKNSGDCKSFALLTISILRALKMPAYLKFAGYLPGAVSPSHVYAFTKNKAGEEIIIDGCYPFFNREKKTTFTKTENMTVTSLSGVLAGATRSEKAAAAKRFLQTLEPKQRACVLRAYRNRCRRTSKGASNKKTVRYISDNYPITGAVIAEDDPISGKKKKAPKKKLTKAEKQARRKKRNAKAKAGAKKFLWGVAFVNLLPIRAAFNAVVAMNVNSLAHNLRYVYRGRDTTTKAEWKKILKVWYAVGGLQKALLKAIDLGAKHKPLFLSKKAKKRFEDRKKNTKGYAGVIALYLDNISGPEVIIAAVGAASGIIAAMIPVIMQGLKKTGQKGAAAEVHAQGQEMVNDYKAQGSPKPVSYDQTAPGETSPLEDDPGSSEEVGKIDQAGLTSLFSTLGQVAQVGIQAAGNAVAKKAAKNPKLNQVLNTAGTASEDYFTGQYLRKGGYTKAAKTFSSSLTTKNILLVGGAAVAALLAIFLIKRK